MTDSLAYRVRTKGCPSGGSAVLVSLRSAVDEALRLQEAMDADGRGGEAVLRAETPDGTPVWLPVSGRELAAYAGATGRRASRPARYKGLSKGAGPSEGRLK